MADAEILEDYISGVDDVINQDALAFKIHHYDEPLIDFLINTNM